MKLFSIFLFFLSHTCFANIEGDKWIFHHAGKDYEFQAFPSQRGLPRVSLNDIASKFKLRIVYDSENFKVTLQNPKLKNHIEFYTYNPHIMGPNFESQLSKAPEFNKVELHLPIDFGDRGLRPLLTGSAPPYIEIPNGKEIDVVIDPGHGGNDWGTHLKVKNEVLKEKDLTLKFAQILSEKLNEKKISTFLTRNSDSFLTLTERSEMANRLKAKLFLSVHLNSSPNAKLRGYEIFVLSLKEQDAEGRTAVEKEQQRIPVDLPEGFEKALADLRAEAQLEKSLKWAKTVDTAMKNFSEAAGNPIKMGPFFVLYGAEMPSILLELGFLTHEGDRNFLLNPRSFTEIANELSTQLANTLKKGL